MKSPEVWAGLARAVVSAVANAWATLTLQPSALRLWRNLTLISTGDDWEDCLEPRRSAVHSSSTALTFHVL